MGRALVEDKCELDCRGSQEIVGRSRLMLHNLPGRDVRLSEKEEERGKSLTSAFFHPLSIHPHATHRVEIDLTRGHLKTIKCNNKSSKFEA